MPNLGRPLQEIKEQINERDYINILSPSPAARRMSKFLLPFLILALRFGVLARYNYFGRI